jgi:hypothetical protein
MKSMAVSFRLSRVTALALCVLLLVGAQVHAETDPLPSWNDGPAKQAIVEFVKNTTDKASPKFVPPEKRIATFDQDGKLWVEQPMYTQVVFAFERVVALACSAAPGMEDRGAIQGDHHGGPRADGKIQASRYGKGPCS